MSDPRRPSRHRRRSLKALLHIPVPSRTAVATPAAGTVREGSEGKEDEGRKELPADIIIEIAERVSWTGDLLSLSLCSKQTHEILLPLLYSSVVLRSSSSCKCSLTLLQRRPDLCRLIRKLALRPNYYLSWPRADGHVEEEWVVDAVQKISPHLGRLDTFDWDGLEMPGSRGDEMWRDLRESCPLLKTIYVNVGYRPLDPDSYLFDFTDLKTFSLTARYGLSGSDLFPSPEHLPIRLWKMLDNCPNIEELSISSFSSSSRTFDIVPLLTSTTSFPHLKSLTLGPFGYNMDFSISLPNEDFSSFITAHAESLEFMRISWSFKRWLSPDTLDLSIPAPRLTALVGVYQHILALPHPELLESVEITCEPVYESRVADVRAALRKCTNLKMLDVWVLSTEGCVGILEGLAKSVEEVSWMCTGIVSKKSSDVLAHALALHTPHLKVLSLTRGHAYTGETMLSSVQRLLRIFHPLNLEQVNIRWAREKCLGHLKQEGSYDILPDGQLSVWERGIRSRAIGGGVFERRYRCRLPPKKTDATAVEGVNVGLLPLVPRKV